MCVGACVPFFPRTQKSVTLSSTKAEYVAMSDGLKGMIFLWYLWTFIFPDRDVGCTVGEEDDIRALHLANNPTTRKKLK